MSTTTTLRQVRIQFAAAVWLLESFRDGKIAVDDKGVRKALWRLEQAEIVLLTQSISVITSPNDDLDKEVVWSFTPPPNNWIAPSSWTISPEYSQAARDILSTTFPYFHGMPIAATGSTAKPAQAKPPQPSPQYPPSTTSPIAFSTPRPTSDSLDYAQSLSCIYPLLIQLHNYHLLAHQQLTQALEANSKALSTSRRLIADVDTMLALSSTAAGSTSS